LGILFSSILWTCQSNVIYVALLSVLRFGFLTVA
jgi:hypothetical protein